MNTLKENFVLEGTARIFSGSDNPVGVIETIEDFKQFPERKVDVNSTRRINLSNTALFVHKKDDKEKIYVLHFSTDHPYKLLASERLIDWDQDAILTLHPKE